MFREPWFRIIDVTEARGLSLADIARQEAEKGNVTVAELRGASQMHNLGRVRRAIYRRARLERPDLSSSQIAQYMRKCSSTVRHAWANMETSA